MIVRTLTRASSSSLSWQQSHIIKTSLPNALPTRATPTRRRLQHTRTPPQPSAPRHRTTPRVEIPSEKPQSLRVTFINGQQSDFHHIWLRDHCREPRSFHPDTKQKLVDSARIPIDLKPDFIESVEDGIKVTWPTLGNNESAYTSYYPLSFLISHSYDPHLLPPETSSRKRTFWTSEIATSIPTVAYEQVMQSEQGVYEWVKRIAEYGFCFVEGIPPTPEATEGLVRRIAFIRETHYGAFWDFTADLKHGDLAYSNYELRSHTDTTYFTDPCGLQLFHLLSPSSSHQGGENLLVDGFRAASILKSSHPHLYEIFSTLPIPAHASGTGSESIPSGVHMTPLTPSPVFNHHDTNGELIQVRWNGDDRGPIGGEMWRGKMELWYEAVREWEKILRSAEATLWTKMKRGTAIIFDNHRVLHGRSAFTGERRLCGAYVSGDDFRSRLKGLETQFGSPDEERRATLRAFGVGDLVKNGAWKGY